MSGYAENAAELIARYESVDFVEKHAKLLALMPEKGSRALDVGAGAGGDAAWLARRGYDVVAVEPAEPFRDYARERHASPKIEWLDDCLPHLPRVVERGAVFDLILASAVWMHLTRGERAVAMTVVASLLAPGGVLYITLRHGRVPEGRVMFDVPPEEALADAITAGLEVLSNSRSGSIQAVNRNAGVTWSRLAFSKRA
jgi:SAM-dependent methyltransferase